jgi:hypothetical protein
MKQDLTAWKAGHAAGIAGKSPATPRGLDGLAFQAGVIEGKAERARQRRPQIHNPATGQLQAIELITDRAKRYRAQQANQQTEKRCIYCGQPGGRLDNEHINGRESDAAPENLAYSCRPCNTTKGAYLLKEGIGERTAQYNPTRAGGAATLTEWKEALAAISPHKGAKYAPRNYGLFSEMTTAEGVAMIRATPHSKRSDFARTIWNLRKARGTAGAGQESVPF